MLIHQQPTPTLKFFSLIIKTRVLALFVFALLCLLSFMLLMKNEAYGAEDSRATDLKSIFEDSTFFEPDACVPSTPNAATGADTAVSPNAATIWNYLIDKGLYPIQAAGILGNIQRESNFSPEALNPSSGSYGIVQWLGGRKTKLQALANYQTLEVQMDYMWSELQGAYKNSVFNKITAADTIEKTTWIVLTAYEIPCIGDPNIVNGSTGCKTEYEKRLQFAQQLLAQLDDGTAADSCSQSIDDPVFVKLYENASAENMEAIDAMDHGPIEPDIFVIHFTVGNTEGMGLAKYFHRSGRGLGVQFSVGKDGTTYQYFPMDNMRRTAHANSVNSHALGVEINARDANELLNNKDQFKAMVSLAKYVCEYYSMPCSDPKGDITGSSASDAQGLLGHSEAPGNTHSDPDTINGNTSLCTGRYIDRSDASTHAYMLKLRRALGYTSFIEGSEKCASGGQYDDLLNNWLEEFR